MCIHPHKLRVKIFLPSSSWGVHLSEWYATSRKCKDKWTPYNRLYTSLHNRVCQWLAVNITHTTFHSAENSGAWMFSRNTEQIGTIKWYYHSVSQIICWQVKWVILLLLCCMHSFRKQQHFGKLQLFREGFRWAGMWQCVSICASCSWVDTLFCVCVSACITRKCSWCEHQRNLPWLLQPIRFLSVYLVKHVSINTRYDTEWPYRTVKGTKMSTPCRKTPWNQNHDSEQANNDQITNKSA